MIPVCHLSAGLSLHCDTSQPGMTLPTKSHFTHRQNTTTVTHRSYTCAFSWPSAPYVAVLFFSAWAAAVGCKRVCSSCFLVTCVALCETGTMFGAVCSVLRRIASRHRVGSVVCVLGCLLSATARFVSQDQKSHIWKEVLLTGTVAALYYTQEQNLTRQQIRPSALIRYFDSSQTQTELFLSEAEYTEAAAITKKWGKSHGVEPQTPMLDRAVSHWEIQPHGPFP